MSPLESWDVAIELFAAYCRAKALQPRTIEFYCETLAHFAAKSGITPEELTPAAVRLVIVNASSPRMANHTITVLKTMCNYFVEDGYFDRNPIAKLPKQKVVQKVIETFTPEQLDAMLKTCKGNTFLDIRDRALLLFMVDTGIRATELSEMKLSDVDWNQQIAKITHGKCGKERIVPFGVGVKQALLKYIYRRGSLESPLLFVTQYGRQLNKDRIREAIRRRGIAAKITGVRISPHTLRHTFAKQWLLNGGDAFSLQKILGHSDMNMTRRYVNLAQSDVTVQHQRYSPVDKMGVCVTRKRIS